MPRPPAPLPPGAQPAPRNPRPPARPPRSPLLSIPPGHARTPRPVPAGRPARPRTPQPRPRRRRPSQRPDPPRHHRHLHRRHRPVRRHLRHRRPDRLDQRPRPVVHPRREAGNLARRRPRSRRPPRRPRPPRHLLTPVSRFIVTGSAPASASRTVYPLRARIRCHKCQRRFHGITRPSRKPGQNYIYYLCPHNPKNPRHAQAHPKHGRISVKEEIITAALARFMDTYLLGHDRAAMLQVQLPAGAAGQAERRDRQAATLRQKLARIQTAQKGLMTQTEQLGDDTTPAANAMRDRIREQFTERYNEHTAIKTELDTLTASIPAVNDPTLLDELPYAPWGAGTGPRHHPRNPVRRLRHPVPLPPRRQPGHHLGHHHRHHPRHHHRPPHRPPHRQ